MRVGSRVRINRGSFAGETGTVLAVSTRRNTGEALVEHTLADINAPGEHGYRCRVGETTQNWFAFRSLTGVR